MRLKIKDLEEKLSNTMQKCEEEVSLSRRNPSFFFSLNVLTTICLQFPESF